MTKIITIIIALVLIIGGFLIYNKRGEAPTQDINTAATPLPTSGSNTAVIEKSVVKEITVTASNFAFNPKSITVDKGDTVKLTLKDAQGTHNWKIDEFNTNTRILNSGEEQVITFVADKSGSFEYYCSVGNHRAMGMVGSLIVK